MKCSNHFGAKRRGLLKVIIVLAPKGASQNYIKNIRCDINAVNKDDKTANQDQEVAAFKLQPQQQQQRYPQQNSNYKGNQQRGKQNNKNSYP